MRLFFRLVPRADFVAAPTSVKSTSRPVRRPTAKDISPSPALVLFLCQGIRLTPICPSGKSSRPILSGHPPLSPARVSGVESLATNTHPGSVRLIGAIARQAPCSMLSSAPPTASTPCDYDIRLHRIGSLSLLTQPPPPGPLIAQVYPVEYFGFSSLVPKPSAMLLCFGFKPHNPKPTHICVGIRVSSDVKHCMLISTTIADCVRMQQMVTSEPLLRLLMLHAPRW